MHILRVYLGSTINFPPTALYICNTSPTKLFTARFSHIKGQNYAKHSYIIYITKDGSKTD